MLSVCLLCLCSHRSCCHPCVIQLLSPVCYMTHLLPKVSAHIVRLIRVLYDHLLPKVSARHFVHRPRSRADLLTGERGRQQCQFEIGVSAKLVHTKLVREQLMTGRGELLTGESESQFAVCNLCIN